MAFNSFADFWAMGGYGFYVWLAYGVTLLSLLILILNTLAKKRNILKSVNQRIKRAQRINKAKNMENIL